MCAIWKPKYMCVNCVLTFAACDLSVIATQWYNYTQIVVNVFTFTIVIAVECPSLVKMRAIYVFSPVPA